MHGDSSDPNSSRQRSAYGERFRENPAILDLMEDLDRGLNPPARKGADASAAAEAPAMLMLGGGNPGRIPEVEAALRSEMERLMADGDRFERMIGIYDHPQGSREFREACAELLHRECGWPVDAEMIALTNGSQSAFYQLFNLFGGQDAGGRMRRILLPMTPEYIGYADAGMDRDLFEALPARIESLEHGEAGVAGAPEFRYLPDFAAIEERLLDDGAEHRDSGRGPIGALCLSRPTNPSGNVVSDADLTRLSELAQAAGVPLILDCAYGLPFPGLDYTNRSTPFWNPNTIVTLSLSKAGMPGVRTGIVVADRETAAALRRMNAVMNLSGGGVGPALARRMIASGELTRLSREVIRPYYAQKATAARSRLQAALADLPCRLHASEGAFFLWLWCRDAPVDSQGLYERLRERGVLVVPGQHYFPGLPADADFGSGAERHRRECLRISFALDEATVAAGLDRIADLLHRIYAAA